MTQEDKQLLLKDLCARLPYEVECEIRQREGCSPVLHDKCTYGTLRGILEYDWCVKHYLRPISSMTEKEKEELRLTYSFIYSDYPFDDEEEDEDSIEGHYEPSVETFDWYNKNMFDYRGLISKGLALEAPEGMYN